MANYALRLPESLMNNAKQMAEEEQVSMNQFFVTAIAEKVASLKTAEFFQQRADRARASGADGLQAWLAASPNTPAAPGDEWTSAPGAIG